MPNVKPISDEAAANIIAEMQIIETNDLGPTIIHRGIHRHRGRVAVIATSLGPCFVVRQATRPALDFESTHGA